MKGLNEVKAENKTVKFLLFMCEKHEARGGMRDLVSSFTHKRDLVETIESIINSPEWNEKYKSLHFYDVVKNTTFDIKTKNAFEALEMRDDDLTTYEPSLEEMSGLAELKRQKDK